MSPQLSFSLDVFHIRSVQGLQLSGFLPLTNLSLSVLLFPGEALSAGGKEERGPKSHTGHYSPRDLESSQYY